MIRTIFHHAYSHVTHYAPIVNVCMHVSLRRQPDKHGVNKYTVNLNITSNLATLLTRIEHIKT